jgi:two-component system, chemotaxis family, protein-glutamate methylesterase/glutaminase
MPQTATILIVDDSRIFRGAIEAAVSGQDGLAVAGSVFSGQKALDVIRSHPPDIVTLDVDMPGMDGLQTLQQIQQFNRSRPLGPEIGVLMVSAFTKRGADVTMQALQAGAFDFVTKPSGSSAEESLEILRQDLLPKVRMFLARRRRTATGDRATPLSLPIPPLPPGASKQPVGLPRIVRAVLIGASTGGPKALGTILPDLSAAVDAPIVVVQHMPAEFTRSLADNLARQSRCTVVEAEEGQFLESRTVYIARGGKHLVLRADPQGRLVLGLNDQPLESGCRPSASVLFRSAAATVGRDAVAIVLTGMGNDGTAGLGPLKRAGGFVIAQDEASSVVWGMPGSAVAAGLVDAVLPLGDIAPAIAGIAIRRSPK